MSSSATNDITKWSNEQLCEHDDDEDDLYKRKSTECRCHMKAQKEVEHQRAEEERSQLEEEFEEEEMAKVAKEREALKGQSEEEAEVDESV
ncbi:hypothetical protein PAXRUDRAFT_19709 [Paxillus rubicundulus Ve08.2h10]|uniref:Unplaced genomic scaffold scaffold_3891, whole genome shotgun sequence n=1 Tax=Paxillus rubicundulus Ve08.2h10 TaxID=930991 RepID=A0A0D0D3S2_9AGAM|nr:hypothetical protein PAXRUDRAFT_19709 [Paxillus rubicundulus Ve08.2h10]